MKTIVFLTPAEARYGFSLTGVVQRIVKPGELAATLREVVQDPQAGLVVVDERLLAELGEERFRELERRCPGLVIVLPAPEKGAPEEDYALRLVRRAIGYQMRINL